MIFLKLQIAAYLLCGQSVTGSTNVGVAGSRPGTTPSPYGSAVTGSGFLSANPSASPVHMKPTPPKKTALDPLVSSSGSLGKSPIAASASKIVQVWSLTKFYSIDFSKSRIDVKKFVFNKRTIKVCVSSC